MVASPSDKQWFVNAPSKPVALMASQTATSSNVPESVKVALSQSTVKTVQTPMTPLKSTEEEQQLARELETQRRELEAAMRAPIKSNMLTPQSMSSNNVASSRTAHHNGTLLTDDPNEQGEKKAFLRETTTTPTHIARLQDPVTAFELKAGTVIPGVMISGINSDLPGFITAQVRQSVYDTTSGRYLLLPQGSKLFGQYDSQVVYGQERVLVVWNQVTFPNGQTLDLSSMPGTDMSGYSGFTDQVNNHYLKIFGSVLLMSVMTTAAQQSQPSGDNNSNSNPNVSQTLAASVGSNSAQTMNMMVRKNLSIQPTLEIRPGYLFNIVVTKNMVFESAYRGESKGDSA
jgi:type IV secretion system protein VirB10